MAGLLTDDDYEDWVDWGAKVFDQPEMHGDACVFMDHVEKLENTLKEAFVHLLEEHIHDRETCPDIFTSRGTLKSKWQKLEDELEK